MKNLVLGSVAFTLIVGGILAWYAFKPAEGLPGTLVVTAYIEPDAAAGGTAAATDSSAASRSPKCVRRLALVVTVVNTAKKPATIKAVRFLAGKRTNIDSGRAPRRLAADDQVDLRFNVLSVYKRLRAQRLGNAITRVEVLDGAGIRYRAPVELNTNAPICST